MILDRLDRAERYFPLHPGFAEAFARLRGLDLATMSEGRHPLDGDRLWAIVNHTAGKGMDAVILESHRKFIDIQYIDAGVDRMGWRALADCTDVSVPYNEERDIVFFHGRPAAWFDVQPGQFAVFFPDDVHAPLAGSGPLRRAIIKVAVA